MDVAFSEMGSLSLSGLAKAGEVSTDHIWRHQTKNNSVQGIPHIFFSLLFLTLQAVVSHVMGDSSWLLISTTYS